MPCLFHANMKKFMPLNYKILSMYVTKPILWKKSLKCRVKCYLPWISTSLLLVHLDLWNDLARFLNLIRRLSAWLDIYSNLLSLNTKCLSIHRVCLELLLSICLIKSQEKLVGMITCTNNLNYWKPRLEDAPKIYYYCLKIQINQAFRLFKDNSVIPNFTRFLKFSLKRPKIDF